MIRERRKERDRDAEDEEEAYERRKLEKKLREKEAAYQEVDVWNTQFWYDHLFVLLNFVSCNALMFVGRFMLEMICIQCIGIQYLMLLFSRD